MKSSVFLSQAFADLPSPIDLELAFHRLRLMAKGYWLVKDK